MSTPNDFIDHSTYECEQAAVAVLASAVRSLEHASAGDQKFRAALNHALATFAQSSNELARYGALLLAARDALAEAAREPQRCPYTWGGGIVDCRLEAGHKGHHVP